MMQRKITLRSKTYVVDFGNLEEARVTIQGEAVTVSPDLNTRTPDADFDAVFTGAQSIEIFTAPTKMLEDGTIDLDCEIGPLEPGSGETPLSIAKAKKLQELAAARYTAESTGVETNGIKISTDDRSQSKITGAALQAVDDPTYTCRWKTEDGFIELSAEQIKVVAKAVRAHVQAQFDREAELAAQVAAAETIQAVEAIRWS